MAETWIRSEADRLRDVVVSPPLESYGRLDLNEHNWSESPNLEEARREHEAYVDLMRAEGVKVHEVPPTRRFPNLIYPRDAALVGPRGAWLSRFGLPSRRGEETRVRKILEALGVPIAGQTKAPGTFEGGGDSFLLGRVAFIARSERTNGAGGRQLARHLEAEGYEVRIVPVTLSFHLGEPLGIVDHETILVDERWAGHAAFRDFERIEVPATEVGGGNVLVLGPRKLVLHGGYPESMRRMRDRGVDVIPFDFTELKKAGGGPQCLTLPVRRA